MQEETEGTVDPESDEELAELPVPMLRQYLQYWKWPKSEAHHLERTGQRVDRHRQIERLTAAVNARSPSERGPGRPLGHQLGDDTKMKIGYARIEGAGGVEAPPPCDDLRVPLGVRNEAFERDSKRCAACHDWYRDEFYVRPKDGKRFQTPDPRQMARWLADGYKRVREINHNRDIRMYLVPGGDPMNPASLVTLCGFCRQTAKDAGGVDILGITAEVG